MRVAERQSHLFHSGQATAALWLQLIAVAAISLLLGWTSAGLASELPNQGLKIVYWFGALTLNCVVQWMIIGVAVCVDTGRRLPNFSFVAGSWLLSMLIAREPFVWYLRAFEISTDVSFVPELVSYPEFLVRLPFFFHHNFGFFLMWVGLHLLVYLALSNGYSLSARLRRFFLGRGFYLCWPLSTTANAAPAKTTRNMPVHEESGLRLLSRFGVTYPEEILYLKAQDHYVVACTSNRKKIAFAVFRDLTSELESYGFIRCHRSYTVRVGAISRVAKGTLDWVEVHNGDRIKVSRTYSAKLKEELSALDN